MLKRLEIQCVFKELVKDIVVKGHLTVSIHFVVYRQKNSATTGTRCTVWGSFFVTI